MTHVKKLFVALVAALALVGYIGLRFADVNATPVAYTWYGDIARLDVVALDSQGTCSGWMITETELLTAGHCVDQLIRVTACFYPDLDCETPIPLTLVGADQIRDVAVMRLPDGVKRRPVSMRSDQPAPGETVYAVGYPRAKFAITSGMYSQRRRPDELWNRVAIEWLQHSALTAPGSSGGALFDAEGRLIGMTLGVQTAGIRVAFFFFGIASPVDVILHAFHDVKLAEATHVTDVVGEPEIAVRDHR